MRRYGLSYKWQAIKCRFRGYSLRTRVWRLARHFKNFRRNRTQDKSASVFVGQPIPYVVDLLFYVLDIFAFGELYETICDFGKYNTRALYDREREIVAVLFGNTVDINRIRIDEFALVPKWMRLAYVSLYTINCFGKMSEDLFVHELIHIWQYEKQGSAYIPRALRAQKSAEGYNYGGAQVLSKGPSNIWSYNYEQQGDILADYWRAKHKRRTKWDNQANTIEPYLTLVKSLASKNSELT